MPPSSSTVIQRATAAVHWLLPIALMPMSSPTPIPCAKRSTTRKIGARMPILSYVGSRPMAKVATPMITSE